MSTNEFDELQNTLQNSGTTAAIDQICSSLRQQKRYHELFEGLKIKVRNSLGLPIRYNDEGDDLEETIKTQLEDGLIDACREVGTALIQEGNIRDGYSYLRPVGDLKLVKQLLSQVPVTDENADQFIEICFHESVDIERGMQLVLQHYGTCNSITTFESAMYGRPRPERAIGAKLLLEHGYQELKENIVSHIEREESKKPDENSSIGELIRDRDWLTADGGYHIDTTHLSSIVRFARDLSDEGALRKALELTDYGSKLDKQLQYPGDEPFGDMYESHRHYFNALLDPSNQEAFQYFEQKARACNAHEETTMAIEVYVDLLHRTGQTQKAIDVSLELIPAGMQTTGFGPNLFDLCEASGDFEKLKELCRDRNDYLGFAMAALQSKQ